MPLLYKIQDKTVATYQELLDDLKRKLPEPIRKDRQVKYLIFHLEEECGERIAAVAFKGKWCAICTPKSNSDNCPSIFEYIIREMEDGDSIMVFSTRDYVNVKKCLYGKKVEITLNYVSGS